MWKFSEVTYFLAALYYRPDDIYRIIQHAGLRPQSIDYSGNAITFWTNIIRHAEDRVKVKDVLKAVLDDGHEKNEYLLAMWHDPNTAFKSPYKISSDVGVPVQGGQLELLTNGKKTFLPVSFLSKGIVKAKSVVRIINNEGSGTGFIVNRNYLMTNNHVISDVTSAILSKIQFNYQLDEIGKLSKVTELKLDPAAGFQTSSTDDWTVVKIKDYDDNLYSEFGELQLKNVAIKQNDFVNIIQHPAGEHKQIALYHNLVVNTTTDRIHYLTDTQPGSSGSPVFDSDWNVVALHHQGRSVPTNGVSYLFNQGININLIISELRKKGFFPS